VLRSHPSSVSRVMDFAFVVVAVVGLLMMDVSFLLSRWVIAP
jgi:hypothetical protein